MDLDDTLHSRIPCRVAVQVHSGYFSKTSYSLNLIFLQFLFRAPFMYVSILLDLISFYHIHDTVLKQYYSAFMEKAMAPHSSTLAWKIPWTEEPGRLQSMGSLRVRQDWATSLSLFTLLHWRRKWQPTPVFLPGESQGQGSLLGCHLWGRTESDTTEVT